MTTQGILFIVGIVFLAVAAICAGVAVWLFFKRDIPGIRDDLTGKKRAKIIAEMDEITPADRRRKNRSTAPVGAAAAEAASMARRAAEQRDTDDVQATSAPKPKHAEPDSEGARAAAEADTRAAEEAATLVETGGDDTIIGAATETTEHEDITVVEGVSGPAPPNDEVEEGPPQHGVGSFEIVKKIVLADSGDFIRIGRQGDQDAERV